MPLPKDQLQLTYTAVTVSALVGEGAVKVTAGVTKARCGRYIDGSTLNRNTVEGSGRESRSAEEVYFSVYESTHTRVAFGRQRCQLRPTVTSGVVGEHAGHMIVVGLLATDGDDAVTYHECSGRHVRQWDGQIGHIGRGALSRT